MRRISATVSLGVALAALSPRPSCAVRLFRPCWRESRRCWRRRGGCAMIGGMGVVAKTEHAVARCLAETVDPRDALTDTLKAIGESLGWQWGAVWEPATDRPEVLRCVETWHAVGAAG